MKEDVDFGVPCAGKACLDVRVSNKKKGKTVRNKAPPVSPKNHRNCCTHTAMAAAAWRAFWPNTSKGSEDAYAMLGPISGQCFQCGLKVVTDGGGNRTGSSGFSRRPSLCIGPREYPVPGCAYAADARGDYIDFGQNARGEIPAHEGPALTHPSQGLPCFSLTPCIFGVQRSTTLGQHVLVLCSTISLSNHSLGLTY